MNYIVNRVSLSVILLGLLVLSYPAYAHERGVLEVEVGSGVDGAVSAHDTDFTDDSDSGTVAEIDTKTTIEANMSGSRDNAEVGGTEDINIGVGEQKSADKSKEDKEEGEEGEDGEGMGHASMVSVSAKEIRGWDPEEKREFLTTVKTHAEVKSNQDLENFAKGVMVEDEEVEDIEVTEKSVSVKYNVPAKFLGLFKSEIEQETTVTFGDGEHGKVKVRYPWHRIFFKVDKQVQEEALTEILLPEIDDEVLVTAEGEAVTPAAKASIVARVVAALKLNS
ncbi:MAG: hypothetical protein H6779_05095 [Candidatus Nomurabacteria bacterium]|nr:hypothetical protein [Candidatus Nomurabacteria bacterium]USN87744.1 MAG: hypothetical protein H6779_05095 [Candidatus Nomurabacteria bacterium]